MVILLHELPDSISIRKQIPLNSIYDTFDGGNAVSISSRIAIFAQLTDDEKRLFCLFVLFREMKCEATTRLFA